MHNNSDDNLLAWLIAASLNNVPSPQWQDLCKTHSLTLLEVMESSRDKWQQLGLPLKLFAKRGKARKKAEQAFLYVQEQKIQCLTFMSSTYPRQLLDLAQPPCCLFLLGDANKLSMSQVAIVGSRHGTANGVAIARQIGHELAMHDIAVTSGLARGIDAAAHQGAIALGHTVAVLGTGIDICYPQYNKVLRDRILESGGALVTEFFPGTPPRAHHFPIRNRIVAALSLGVLVVEAKIRSGSLITANLAADLGKDVFAVPGNINQPLSEGVNWLIQQGAKLVTKTDDILEEIGVSSQECQISKKTEEKRLATDPLLDSVNFDVTAVDDIAKRSNLSVSEILAALLEYELRGIVAAVPGGYIKLRGK